MKIAPYPLTTLEFSRVLKKLGFPQESRFYWVNMKAWGKDFELMDHENTHYRGIETKHNAFIEFDDTYSAFSILELENIDKHLTK